LLSLEYQNAKLSKKLRTEEVNMEKMEALHRLQLDERDVLLRALTEQLKEMRAKVNRMEEIQRMNEGPALAVKDNYAARLRAAGADGPLCIKEAISLPNIKWDASSGDGMFVQGRLRSREGGDRGRQRDDLAVSASQPNLTGFANSPIRLPSDGSNRNQPQTHGLSKTHKKINPTTVLRESTEKTALLLPRIEDADANAAALATQLG
jgi:uncharacterized protein YhaN